MVKHYKLGNPFETESVVVDVPFENEALSETFGKFQAGENGFLWSYKLSRNDRIFGLGESLHGMNKRGHVYESFCADEPNHTEDKVSLYGAHNFILIVPEKFQPFGVYFDYPGRIRFDIGFTKRDELTVTAEKADMHVYFITAENGSENSEKPHLAICRLFRELTGASYIPPEWAFGYMQSRWGYRTADDIRQVVARYRGKNIPLEAVFMDIDYMTEYKDFTVDPNKYPDFKNFVAEMKDMGIHLVPIIDAGVKIQSGYDVYEEGLKKGYFSADRKLDLSYPFTAAVWPGLCHFPDFFNPEARKWFGDKYKVLLDAGIDGFWNDMNEPALFYSREGLEQALLKIESYKNKNMGIGEYFSFRDSTNLSNKIEDYKNIFHQVDEKTAGNFAVSKPDHDGKVFVNHYDVHNYFGTNMTRSAAESIRQLEPNKDILLFSRASSIGAHRYGGIWTGDNESIWSHLKLNLAQMAGLNMCGFLYSGADTGGFGFNTSRELMMRWIQLSLFTPLFRNHACDGTRNQELYLFEDSKEFQAVIETRYRLLPYIKAQFMKAATENGMYFKPIGFEFTDDERAWDIEDQILCGESMMLAPVLEPNARGRYVYLPEDMTMVSFGGDEKAGVSTDKAFELKKLPKGDHWIEVPAEKGVFFIRNGREVEVAELPESGVVNTQSVLNGTLPRTLRAL